MVKDSFQMTEETNEILLLLKKSFKEEGKTVTELFKQMIITYYNQKGD